MIPCTNEFGHSMISVKSFPTGAVTLTSRTCKLEQLNATKHADDLYAAYSQDDGRLWTYSFVGPFTNVEDYRKYVKMVENSLDPRHYAVIDLSLDKAVGTMA